MGTLSEEIHYVGVCVKIVMFALISYGSEVVKDANSDFGQSHVIPELLTLFWTKRTNCFTFDEDLSTNMEVHKVLMSYLLPMEVNREIILSCMRYSTLIEYDFQSILVHIFIEERTEFLMDCLATSVYLITISFQLLA